MLCKMEDEGASYGAALKGEAKKQSALGCLQVIDMSYSYDLRLTRSFAPLHSSSASVGELFLISVVTPAVPF